VKPRRERDPHEKVQINLRLSEGLRRTLASEAERHHVSLNQEIVLRLQDSLELADGLAASIEALEARLTKLEKQIRAR
jgi:Arc-like DNA binding dprotein